MSQSARFSFRQLTRQYGVWVCVGVLTLVALAAGDSFTEYLRFDREAIATGQWWRIFTSHLTHLSLNHLLLNVAALALAAYVASPDTPVRVQLVQWCWLFLVTGGGLWLFAPDLHYYVGLSGALHGAMIIAIAPSPYYSLRVRLIVIAVITVKVIWEQTGFYDDMANAGMIGGRTEARAHLFGAIAGLVWVGIAGLWRRYEQR